jgi:hypothetical protein
MPETDDRPFRLTDEEFEERYPALHAAWVNQGSPEYGGWDRIRENRHFDFREYGIRWDLKEKRSRWSER